MKLKVLKKHSPLHWEFELFHKGDEPKVIHFYKGVGLLGLGGKSAGLERVELLPMVKVQARLDEDCQEQGRIPIGVNMEQMSEETARVLLEKLSDEGTIPLSFLHENQVKFEPSYAEVLFAHQLTKHRAWKASEIERFAGYQRHLLEALFTSALTNVDSEEGSLHLQAVPDSQLIEKLQEMLEERPLFQVRVKGNGWAPVLLTLDEENAKLRHEKLTQAGKSTQLLQLNPPSTTSRNWRLINRLNKSVLTFKCELTGAFGLLPRCRLDENELRYLDVHPALSSSDEWEIGSAWPQDHNFMIELLCERKAFSWRDGVWTIQKVDGAAARHLSIKCGSEEYFLNQIDVGLFILPNLEDLEELAAALEHSGHFIRDTKGIMKLIDPELRYEL